MRGAGWREKRALLATLPPRPRPSLLGPPSHALPLTPHPSTHILKAFHAQGRQGEDLPDRALDDCRFTAGGIGRIGRIGGGGRRGSSLGFLGRRWRRGGGGSGHVQGSV